jgi:hypothetical protein
VRSHGNGEEVHTEVDYQEDGQAFDEGRQAERPQAGEALAQAKDERQKACSPGQEVSTACQALAPRNNEKGRCHGFSVASA